MLNDLIKLRLNNISNEYEIKYEEIKQLSQKSNKLLDELKKADPNIADKVDSLIGEFIGTYTRIYFSLGFKDGLILGNEINNLK
ncbi:hypothetical protein NE172_02735 [Clostridium botulinum]|uniref:Uncharacterized protein n=1 Tax=Clostridium botulinum TaxID=1491 RepID=A0A6B4JI36_CLOBO|nr:hypothetical protein [Clostridium botulinum]EES51305.1 conserved hypothetical protein [Clostridium botulinum E1 str. 'BoNT E Beluga']MBY6759860.1 hypothetical protein [Clostridium botulinum]MBY6918770.1 hypothetical protein [Clostridium botulinum]MCR1129856.1 hypothetical protein [Clostridium botulinum]NFJ56573.1 hypothetical protein [Clostridium botulinum]